MLFNRLASVIHHRREGGSLRTLLATISRRMIGRNRLTFLSKSFPRGAKNGVLRRVASLHHVPVLPGLRSFLLSRAEGAEVGIRMGAWEFLMVNGKWLIVNG